MTRLNDTRAITSAPGSDELERTVETRKISNGYIRRESTFNRNTGSYKCSEQYMKDPREAAGGMCGPETLADTKQYLGKDV